MTLNIRPQRRSVFSMYSALTTLMNLMKTAYAKVEAFLSYFETIQQLLMAQKTKGNTGSSCSSCCAENVAMYCQVLGLTD